jgi:serine/threonine protein kinase
MAIQIWQPGDKIKNDRFEILKQLGKGGFGITYLAEDTVKKQQVVIKTLNANQQGEADFAQKQENFVKEGFTLKTFNHPHIVKVYEPIDFDGLWGLVMEYIPGQDLADYIIANGRLGEAEALNYIDQIAQALDCVHQQKFFHRDVKPHNIMLRQDRGEAVLIDFGIAKEFVDLETIYLSNSLGTELYKPIEQYEKRGQFGAYTDIYALAVTLYHLLTGAAPGGGSPLYTSKARKDAQDKGLGANLDRHLWEKLTEHGVSKSTQAAIKAGMEIEPSQRPQNITAFCKLLGSRYKQVDQANVVTASYKQVPVSKPVILTIQEESQKQVYSRPVVTSKKALDQQMMSLGVFISKLQQQLFDKIRSLLEKVPQQDQLSTLRPLLKKAPSRPEQLFNRIRSIGLFRSTLIGVSLTVSIFVVPSFLYSAIGIFLHAFVNDEAMARYYTISINSGIFDVYDSYKMRSIARYSISDKKGAIEDYTQLINRRPSDPWSYEKRGWARLNKGDNKGAVDDYTLAIKLNPNVDYYYENRAKAWTALGDHKKATLDRDRAKSIGEASAK